MKTLKTVIPLTENHDAACDGQRTLAIVQAAMSSKQGIEVIKNLAAAGYHRTVVNLLDAVRPVLDMMHGVLIKLLNCRYLKIPVLHHSLASTRLSSTLFARCV